MADPESAGLPRLVRGSVVTHRRRCGKPNCRCADGEALHESTVLSYSDRTSAVRRHIRGFGKVFCLLRGLWGSVNGEIV